MNPTTTRAGAVAKDGIAKKIGDKNRDRPNRIAATIAVCLPSFILVLLISYFFVRCKDNKYIKAAMSGLLPMSVSLIAAAALLLMNKENFIDYRSSLIFAVAFGVTWKWNIHPILLITLSGIAGYILY